MEIKNIGTTNAELASQKLLEHYPEGNKEIKAYIEALESLGLVKQLTPTQIYHFLRICIDYKLDPLKREIFCIPFSNKQGTTNISIVISYMEYIKSAEKNERYQVPTVTTITKDADGKDLKLGEYYTIFKGKRKGDEDYFERTFYMKEWNKGNGEWITKPIFMLEKTAMKNGLSWMYPELKGYISAEETVIRENGEITDIYNKDNVREIKAVDKVAKKVFKDVEQIAKPEGANKDELTRARNYYFTKLLNDFHFNEKGANEILDKMDWTVLQKENLNRQFDYYIMEYQDEIANRKTELVGELKDE